MSLKQPHPTNFIKVVLKRDGQLQKTVASLNVMSNKTIFSPSTLRALDEGLCDIRARPCKRTIVFGDYFLSSENLTCHVRESKVASMLHILIVLFHSVGTLERERILISYTERTTVKTYLWSS